MADETELTLVAVVSEFAAKALGVQDPAVLTGLTMCRDQYVLAGRDERAKAAILRAAEISFARSFPAGTSVVINLTTFEFVRANTRTEALKTFLAAFGRSATGWAFEVGRPIVVGGGACSS
jgi:hypothetical protein